MRFGTLAAAAVSLIVGVQAASAGVIVLTFAGLDNATFADGPLNYYAGGLSLTGAGPGPNHGISFSDNAFTCGTSAADICNGLAKPPAPGNFLIFAHQPGGTSVMDVVHGFGGGFALYYNNVFDPHAVQIFSGLDGTGTLLATLDLPTTPIGFGIAGCGGAPVCPFLPVGVTFSGVAHSVRFADAENDVAFAGITLGSPVAAPEPATSFVFAAALMGLFWRRPRHTA